MAMDGRILKTGFLQTLLLGDGIEVNRHNMRLG